MDSRSTVIPSPVRDFTEVGFPGRLSYLSRFGGNGYARPRGTRSLATKVRCRWRRSKSLPRLTVEQDVFAFMTTQPNELTASINHLQARPRILERCGSIREPTVGLTSGRDGHVREEVHLFPNLAVQFEEPSDRLPHRPLLACGDLRDLDGVADHVGWALPTFGGFRRESPYR
jgi:hypothetical protein